MFTFASNRRAGLFRLLSLATLVTAIAWPAAARAQEEGESSGLGRLNDIKWTVGPATVDVGSKAKLKVPEGYRFTATEGAQTWSELCGNPTNGRELGVIMPNFDLKKNEIPEWFVEFSFDQIGYVKDDEKEELTDDAADELLAQFKEGTRQANETRKQRGWEPVEIAGWHKKPFYDQTTKNLTWAVLVSSEGERTVNYDTRVLGRRGVMNVKMVLDEKQVSQTIPVFNKIVGGLSFTSGESYAEFKSGDKIAEYGLIGLVSGGAAVAAVKWWKPLMKFGIFIVAGIGLAVKKVLGMFKRSPAA